MCGITGVLGDFPPETLEAMTAAIAHRGPDGSGIWIDPESAVGLGHRRLSIIDLSEAAAQPMHSVNDRYVVTFNGEIYNFHELASRMEGLGYKFNPNSDTAILAPLFDHYGPDMVRHLSGIFAFAIWDKRKRELFIVRDHLGIKPLYYAETPRGFLFSSELKALLHAEDVDRSLDETALFSYLTYLWSPGKPTLCRGVKKLLPGHTMRVRGGQVWIQRWYDPPQPRFRAGHPVYDATRSPEDLLATLDEVVDEQLIADVPVGAFLSGGVDSSGIVSSICRDGRQPIDAFCMKFRGPSMKDEGFSEDVEYARVVAQRYGVRLHEVEVDETCLEDLPEMVYYLDEPQADPSPLYVRIISRAARQMGIKVLLSGTGGDDVFTGYRRHQAIHLMHGVRAMPDPMTGLASSVLNSLARGPMKRRLEKMQYMLQTPIEDSLLRAYHYTTIDSLEGLLTPELRRAYHERAADHLEDQLARTRGQHPVNRLLFLELHGFLPDHNLNYTDKLSMAEGIEVRVPLLDPKLLDFAADLPISAKIHGRHTKYILKKALEKRLPHDVLYRSKAGFGAPIRMWLTGPATPLVDDVLFGESCLARGLFDPAALRQLVDDTRSGVRDGAYTILSLLVIELWFRQFADPKTPTPIGL